MAASRTGVLVVGGGITGLSAAFELSRAGVPTVLVEASERFGGKLRTERAGGFLVESGPDSFVAYRPAAIELARELGLDDRLVRPIEPRQVSIRAGGRMIPLPQEMGVVLPGALRPFLTTSLLSPLDKLRAGLDVLLPRTRLAGDVGVGPYLRRRLGPALVDRLAGPLIGSVYGTPIDELSLLAVVPQLREAELRHRSLLFASLAAWRERSGSTASPFVTFAAGMGELVDRLVAALRAAPDVELRTGAPVAAIERRGSRVDGRLRSGERLRSEATIVAAPGPVAAGLLEGVAPAAAAATRRIPHGTSEIVTLAYRADQFGSQPAGHGFLVAAGEQLVIDACTFSSNKWPARAPDDCVLVRGFVGSRSGRSTGRSHADLVARVAADIATTLGVRGEPLLVRVSRWPAMMPQYTVGHLARAAAIEDALTDLPGLVLAGASYRGAGVPDCIAQGRTAAGRAIAVASGGARRPSAGAGCRAADPGWRPPG